MTDEEHQARVEGVREFHAAHLQFHAADDRPEWVDQLGVLLEELDRADRVIAATYDALEPAADDIMGMIYAEVDG